MQEGLVCLVGRIAAVIVVISLIGAWLCLAALGLIEAAKMILLAWRELGDTWRWNRLKRLER